MAATIVTVAPFNYFCLQHTKQRRAEFKVAALSVLSTCSRAAGLEALITLALCTSRSERMTIGKNAEVQGWGPLFLCEMRVSVFYIHALTG